MICCHNPNLGQNTKPHGGLWAYTESGKDWSPALLSNSFLLTYVLKWSTGSKMYISYNMVEVFFFFFFPLTKEQIASGNQILVTFVTLYHSNTMCSVADSKGHLISNTYVTSLKKHNLCVKKYCLKTVTREKGVLFGVRCQ